MIIDAWMQHPSAEFLDDPDEVAELFLHANAERVFGLAASHPSPGAQPGRMPMTRPGSRLDG